MKYKKIYWMEVDYFYRKCFNFISEHLREGSNTNWKNINKIHKGYYSIILACLLKFFKSLLNKKKAI